MKILKSNWSQHKYRNQVKIEHSTVEILTISGVDLILVEGITVTIKIRILDKDNITVILKQEIKQLAITINGAAKPISGRAQIELKRHQGKASKAERKYR